MKKMSSIIPLRCEVDKDIGGGALRRGGEDGDESRVARQVGQQPQLNAAEICNCAIRSTRY